LETDLFRRLYLCEFLTDAFLVLLVDERVNIVPLGGEPDAEEHLQLVADGEVGDLPLECLERGQFDLGHGRPLQLQLGLLDEHFDLVFALVLLDVLGGQRKARDRERLPDLFFEILAREADVDHDRRGVAGPRQEVDGFAEFEHPVNEHAALLQLFELFPVCVVQHAVEGRFFLHEHFQLACTF
jgi:hypothetical protein